MSDPAAPGSEPPLPERPRRRRRVWPWIVAAIVIVVLVAGLFVADAAARSYAQNVIRDKITSALGLPAGAEVEVTVGGGSVLLQALSGHLRTVDVDVPRLAFGELVGSASVHATQVPLDQDKPVGTLRIAYTVRENDVSALASDLSGLKLDSVTLQKPEIVAAATFRLFGLTIPVGLGLTPSTSQGELVFTPTSILVSGTRVTSGQLLATPGLGALAKSLLQQQDFCIARYLPRALTATSATVSGKTLVLTFSGDGAALGGTEFTTKGSCP